jgi:hypothetical protein
MSDIAQQRGGSNYAWFNLAGASRAPFGVLANYSLPGPCGIIKAQLAHMRETQDRLRIPIYHYHQANDGTSLDSSSNGFNQDTLNSIRDLLAHIHKLGYKELLVSFHPQAYNSPLAWPKWDEAAECMYQENWHSIRCTRQVLDESGLPYRLDLYNEATPAPGQDILKQYAMRLWTDYLNSCQREKRPNNTVGFSIIAGEPDRFDSILEIYQGSVPEALDLHIYDQPYAVIQNAASVLGRSPILRDLPWIIGETYYNCRCQANALRSAIQQQSRSVLFLLQWPLTYSRTARHVDVGAPLAFDQYSEVGF